MSIDVLRIDLDCALIMGERFVRLAPLEKGVAKVELGRGKLRLGLQRFSIMSDGFVNVPEAHQSDSGAVLRISIAPRLNTSRDFKLCQRGFPLAIARERLTKVEVCISKMRSQQNGFAVLSNGFGRIPRPQGEIAQIIVHNCATKHVTRAATPVERGQ